MRKSNSTTPALIPSRPRYRHPSSMYHNARQLRLTIETELPEMQRLIVARLFAMAEYLFSTPAGGVLAERMYLALGDAWRCNRNTHGDTSQNPWDHTTVDHHSAILHAINYADGNCDDGELDEELAAIQRSPRRTQATLKEALTASTNSRVQKNNRATARAAVVNIEDWKRARAS